MGYYTSYSLKVYEGERTIQEILAELIETGEFEYLDYALDEDGDSLEPCKWYDHEADLIEISKRYPDIVFVLKGEGEEPGDLWYKYFKNGKIQRCYAEITFEPYDESKLVGE
jgi:hypothetical protein